MRCLVQKKERKAFLKPLVRKKRKREFTAREKKEVEKLNDVEALILLCLPLHSNNSDINNLRSNILPNILRQHPNKLPVRHRQRLWSFTVPRNAQLHLHRFGFLHSFRSIPGTFNRLRREHDGCLRSAHVHLLHPPASPRFQTLGYPERYYKTLVRHRFRSLQLLQ